MPTVVLQGEHQRYMFSVVMPEPGAFPDWGGIYIAVKAGMLGMKMEECVIIGACDNFKKYEDKILAAMRGKCSHVYLLPEHDLQQRRIVLQDLLATEAFSNVAGELEALPITALRKKR